MRNKSMEQVSLEMATVAKSIAALQTRQTRLNTLYQFQQHGVTRAYGSWYVANGRLQIQA